MRILPRGTIPTGHVQPRVPTFAPGPEYARLANGIGRKIVVMHEALRFFKVNHRESHIAGNMHARTCVCPRVKDKRGWREADPHRYGPDFIMFAAIGR